MKLFSKNQGEKKQFNGNSKNNILTIEDLFKIRGGAADEVPIIIKK
jgi:hypothetical protein